MLTLDNDPIKPFKDKNEFSIYIEKYAISNGIGLISSILQYCEDADVEIESTKKLISESLRDKIEEEAIAENIILRSCSSTTLVFD